MWSGVCSLVPGWSQQTCQCPSIRPTTANCCLPPALPKPFSSPCCWPQLHRTPKDAEVCLPLTSCNTKRYLLLNNFWPNLPSKSMHVWSLNFPVKPPAHPPAIWLWSGSVSLSAQPPAWEMGAILSPLQESSPRAEGQLLQHRKPKVADFMITGLLLLQGSCVLPNQHQEQ